MDIMRVFGYLLLIGTFLIIFGLGMYAGFLGQHMIRWHALPLIVGIILLVVSVVGGVIKATLDTL